VKFECGLYISVLRNKAIPYKKVKLENEKFTKKSPIFKRRMSPIKFYHEELSGEAMVFPVKYHLYSNTILFIQSFLNKSDITITTL
jgi:hypothetical protein